MNESIEDGGPAFPEVISEQRGSGGEYWTDTHSEGGMSLRDYFAAKALQGALVNAQLGGLPTDPSVSAIVRELANSCYSIADAMIKARQQ